MNKLLKKVFSRTVVTALLIVIQVAWLAALLLQLGNSLPAIQTVLRILSLVAILFVIKSDMNPSYKIGWILLIAVLPILGGLMYVIFGNKRPTKYMREMLRAQLEKSAEYLGTQESITGELDGGAAGLFKYLEGSAGYPTAKNTTVRYYRVGEEMYADLLPELEKAEKFIFLEYFIIRPGEMWDGVLEILKRKAAAGVDVRIIYDDMGCIDILPANYNATLEGWGIRTMAFNRFVPAVSLVMNNRDHRKITVIDGKVGFTGGINISDEYINVKERFGHWKDTGLMLKGPGVFNLTLMFLEMWNAFNKDGDGYAEFIPDSFEECGSADDGYVLSFSDSPLDNESVGESVYTDMLYQAKDYIYITTPYLAIDSELQTALCMAAKRGVDVRMITPGIPDKKLVYRLTRSYYPTLLRAGVKIYEYTPGFIHAKSFVCDDKLCVVGTINMDYRSLYLHFECGTLMYNNPEIKQVKKDDLDTMEKCRKVELSDMKTNFLGELFDSFLRSVAPLL
ncbi:MAG: cardiolipin synthase [Oscillospiraceae bacterium]|nr:cardiolipin synthase [Oscillospiraceae bacterium]